MASDPMSDLEQVISNTMGSAFEGARRTLAEDIRRRQEGELREARDGAFRALREASSRLDAARTQSDLLSALLEEAGRFASRTALLLTFPDAAQGWAAYGFDGDAGQLRLAYDEPGLRELAGGRGAVTLGGDDSASFARQLGGGAPLEAVLVPLVLRDRVAAALYADRLRSEDVFAPAALQVLVFAAAQSLELQVMRQRAATPTLYGAGAGEAPAGLPLWDPDAAAAAGAAVAAGAAAFAAPAPTYEPEPAPAPEPEPVAAEEPVWAAPAVEEPAAAEEPAWQEPAPAAEPTAFEAADQIEQVEAEPWADDAPTSPGTSAEAWPVEAAPAPWETEAEPAAEAWTTEDAPTGPGEPAAAEPAAEAWQYGEALEEVPAAAAEGDESTGTGYAATAVDDLSATGVEEVGASAVEEAAQPEADALWQQEPAAPESTTTSALYPETPAYPSEATVRISRDLLTAGPLAPQPRAAAEPDFSEDRTVMLNRAAAMPPPAAPAPAPPPPLAPEPPRTTGPVSLPSSGGSTEVQPPPDLEGPGWAFRSEALPTQPHRLQAQQPQHGDESGALHEEARRLARLLVSEIKLYNEEMVEEGRRHRDIYPRLQEDIDRSRQMYEERVDPKVRGEVDYFQQEMVNILAGGDAGALGM